MKPTRLMRRRARGAHHSRLYSSTAAHVRNRLRRGFWLWCRVFELEPTIADSALAEAILRAFFDTQ